MPSWYSMSIMIAVPVVIYALVLLAFTVSQYFTVKHLCFAIKAMREERAELFGLIQTLRDAGSFPTEEGGKEMSISIRPGSGS